MSVLHLCLTAALWALSGLSAHCARVRLRVWFYSALEYTQACLLEKSARFPFRFPLSPALWLTGYFEEDHKRLAWVLLGGLFLPVLSLVLGLIAGWHFVPAGTAVLLLLQAAPLLMQLASRRRGTDGRMHERFNRYAPLSASDRQTAAAEARKTRVSSLGQRWFPEKNVRTPSGANTLRDGDLIRRLSSY